MLTQTETLNLFLQPVADHVSIRRIQKLLLRTAATNGNEALAATRLLALLAESPVMPFFLKSVYRFSLVDLTEEEIGNIATVQALFDAMAPFASTMRVAVEEGKRFLPKSTQETISDYSTDGAPLDRVCVAVFLILTANMQDL